MNLRNDLPAPSSCQGVAVSIPSQNYPLFLKIPVSLLLLAATGGLGFSADGLARNPVELRDIGMLQVESKYVGLAPGRSSWITLHAQDEEKAAKCGSKYLADVLGYGDVKIVRDPALPGTVLALEGTGQWVLALDGTRLHIVFARSPSAMAEILKSAPTAGWKSVQGGRHALWMDAFDNAAMTFWFSGFGELPKDLRAEFQWYADNQFTSCAVLGNTESRLIAPGVLDTSVMDWQSTMAREFRVPYKIMADMANPVRPASLWNTLPLPHYLPAEGSLFSGLLTHQDNAIVSQFYPGAVTDRNMMDFRRRVGEHLKDDPYFIGHHLTQEMPGGDSRGLLNLAAIAGTPEIQNLWRKYLKEERKYDLASVGRNLFGKPDAFGSWSEVGIPSLRDFLGWGAASIDLKGMWEGRPDPGKVALKDGWIQADDAGKWQPVDSQDLGIMAYGTKKNPCDYYLRKTVTIPAGSTARFFHMARLERIAGSWTFDLWLNGRKLERLSNADPTCPDWDLCYDAGPALKPGENTFVLLTKGSPIPSYVFLSTVGKWEYPGPTPHLNQRFFDMMGFHEWLAMRELEDRMIGIRAGEPYRPMKIMAPHSFIDRAMDLCLQYGAYPHDTGGAAAWWGPFTYSRYAITRGVPNSVEEGSPPVDAKEMQAFMTRYLMMGVDTVDNVAHSIVYTRNPDIKGWIDGNRELLRCIGKQDLVQPVVGILRCGREARLGIANIWSWDMGRGPLLSVGRSFSYANFGDLRSGGVNRFKILLDCGTSVLTEEEVTLIEDYVRQGGTFVAFHNTGVHTPSTAYAWPISRLTGLQVVNGNQPMGDAKIHFNDTQGMWPRLRGQELNGRGLAFDWQKRDFSGVPIALSAQSSDIEVIATWKDGPRNGNIAIASRTLGKGKVITLGSTFYRNGKDEDGRYVEAGTLPYLDELLASLGAPRETVAGSLWSEHWRSKNGIYDIYPVAQLDPKAKTEVVDVSVRREVPVASVFEISARNHPVVAVRSDNGMITIPKVEVASLQSRVFAAPRADIEDGALYWLRVQQRQNGKLAELPPEEIARATMPPAQDVVVLADGWRCGTGVRDQGWIARNDASTSGWRVVRLGSFASLGLPDESLAQFRRDVVLPKDWTGQRVTLTFDAEPWHWGMTRKATLWINGTLAELKQPLQSDSNGNGSFTIELTPAQISEGSLVLALEVDGRILGGNRDQPRPSGVTGTFILSVLPQPLLTTPLTNWTSASELNVLTPVLPGSEVRCLYLETRLSIPATWPGKRLFLHSSEPLGSLFINNRFIKTPPMMKDLDISGFIMQGQENVLRWVPSANGLNRNRPFKGRIPPLELMWMP